MSTSPQQPPPSNPDTHHPNESIASRQTLFLNPYTPTLGIAALLVPASHITRMCLQSLTTLSVFESRLMATLPKRPLAKIKFTLEWYWRRTTRLMGMFGIGFLYQVFETWIYGLEEEEDEDAEDDTIPTGMTVVMTIFDHFILAYTLRNIFFPQYRPTKVLIWNGLLTHFLIETVYRGATKYAEKITGTFGKKEKKLESEDSSRFWKVLKELVDPETISNNYSREYLLRHFRDSDATLSPAAYIWRMCLAYYAQNYYLQKKTGIFGKLKSFLRSFLMEFSVSIATYPLSVIKYSQIKEAHNESFWSSSAILHAKQIQSSQGWSGFYRGFKSHLIDTSLRIVTPIVVWGLTEWGLFSLYKYYHPRSGLPTDNPLWQSSCEVSSSGSSVIHDTIRKSRDNPDEDLDLNQLVETESGISAPPATTADQCCVCMERQRACVMLPCKHLATCVVCSSQLRSCPLCREPIHKTTRIYW